MIRPTPTSTARSSSATLLLLPWKPIRARVEAGRSATASSPPVQTSRLRPSSAIQRTLAHGQERLAGVVDVGAGERVAERAGPSPEVVLVDDVQRRAELARRGRRADTPATVEHAVAVLGDARRPQRGRPGRSGQPAADSQDGPRWPASACRAPASWARIYIRSGAVTPSRSRPRANTIRVASTSSSRARCTSVGSSSPCGSTRHDVVEPVERRRRRLEVARHPVRLAQLGRRRDDGRELGQAPGAGRPRARATAAPGRSRRRPEPMPRSAALRRIERAGRARTARSRPGCRWTRLVQSVEVEVDVGVAGVAHQGVPAASTPMASTRSSIEDHVAGTLRHPHRLARPGPG